jgi:hypothetical protein
VIWRFSSTMMPTAARVVAANAGGDSEVGDDQRDVDNREPAGRNAI